MPLSVPLAEGRAMSLYGSDESLAGVDGDRIAVTLVLASDEDTTSNATCSAPGSHTWRSPQRAEAPITRWRRGHGRHEEASRRT